MATAETFFTLAKHPETGQMYAAEVSYLTYAYLRAEGPLFPVELRYLEAAGEVGIMEFLDTAPSASCLRIWAGELTAAVDRAAARMRAS